MTHVGQLAMLRRLADSPSSSGELCVCCHHSRSLGAGKNPRFFQFERILPHLTEEQFNKLLLRLGRKGSTAAQTPSDSVGVRLGACLAPFLSLMSSPRRKQEALHRRTVQTAAKDSHLGSLLPYFGEDADRSSTPRPAKKTADSACCRPVQESPSASVAMRSSGFPMDPALALQRGTP